jgi:hypothetical protein
MASATQSSSFDFVECLGDLVLRNLGVMFGHGAPEKIKSLFPSPRYSRGEVG